MKRLRKVYSSEKTNRHKGVRAYSLLCFIVIIFHAVFHSSFAQTGENTVKIGLLIRDKGDLQSIRAAKLAIEAANARGGYKDRDFELVIRSCDGPWGVGSKQAVAIIHEDGVPLLVGALDGRNAHLAEQVAAKSHIVMISTLSSDPTLSRAYVPWYFRLVPDDYQQAIALSEQIYHKDDAKHVALIAFDNYDGKMSAEAFEKFALQSGFPAPVSFIGLNEQDLLEQINKAKWDAVVLAGTSGKLAEISGKLKSGHIYGFLNIFNFQNQYKKTPGVRFVTPSDFNANGFETFLQKSKDEYGISPIIPAAYIYDGVSLACEAIKKFGPDSEQLRKGFSAMQYNGITGNIRFGKLGDRDFKLVIDPQ